MADVRLLIDLGNSSLKWAVDRGRGLESVGQLSQQEGELHRLLDDRWADMPAPDSVHVASVAPGVQSDALATWIRAHWGMDPRFVEITADAGGLHNSYTDPGQLGIDRWLAVLAAHRRASQGGCVVDCGTAVTIELFEPGCYLGGYILPGIGLMRQALLDHTGIPRIGECRPVARIGIDTEEAVALGSRLAIAGAVGLAVAELGRRNVMAPAVFVTGGDGAAVAAYLSMDYHLVTDLVLEGVQIVAGSDRR